MSRVRTPLLPQNFETMETLKQKWIKALHNPFYILAWVCLITFMVLVFSSCQPKACPAYAKNNTEQSKNI